MEETKHTNQPETAEETAQAAPETEIPAEETVQAAPPDEAPKEEAPKPDPVEELKAKLAAEHDSYLRLAAEYDNFRKRSQKERDNLYTDIKAETVGKFLPVFDNLQRALDQETADEAYKKGVEMTMNGLIAIMEGLGVKSFGQVGETFDPQLHNAVMHKEDESLGESVIAEVFQTGFKVGEKVVRHAMVVVAN